MSGMGDPFVVVISGAGRGLGNSLAQAYLSRPNCIVLGTVRDIEAPGIAPLRTSAKASGSELVLAKVESSLPTDAANVVEELKARGIGHIDVVIANAGISPPVTLLESVAVDEVRNAFDINALGPLALYQACYPLLHRSSNPKFITISSAAGSIGGMEKNGAFVAPAYCISKSALNWITLSAHCGNKWLIASAINPGLVATDMGNKTAKDRGLEKALITKEQSTAKIMEIIDGATREKTSGRFINAMTGTELQW